MLDADQKRRQARHIWFQFWKPCITTEEQGQCLKDRINEVVETASEVGIDYLLELLERLKKIIDEREA